MKHTMMAGLSVALGFRRPIKVAHYITYRCNLNCDMCGRRAIESTDELSTEACMDLQKAFRKQGTLVWSYSGGECLLRPDIVSLSRSAKDIGLSLIIVTNGLLLPERTEIADYADVLNVSIDGDRESHDALRGKGMYDKTLAGLDALETVRRPGMQVILQTILNNETIDRLDHVLDLARSYRCKVGFNPAIVHRSDVRKENAKRFMPTRQQYQQFVEWLKSKKGSPDAGLIFDEPSFFEAVGDYPRDPRRIACHGGIHQCSIDPFGKVLPCSDFFDFEENYASSGKEFGYGVEGWKQLKKVEDCPYAFCCTAKKNYFFSHPWLIFRKFMRSK